MIIRGFWRLSLLVMLMMVISTTFCAASYRQVSSFICGSETIQVKDRKYQIKKKCDKPLMKETGDLWVYDMGPSDYVYYLYFVDGILERIEQRNQPN